MPDTRIIKPEDNKAGTFGETVDFDEVTSLLVSPVPANAPGIVWANPGTATEEAIYFSSKDAGAGTINGLIRDFTNLNGGVGRGHANGDPWEVMQSARVVENIVDALAEGYIYEQATIAKVDGDTFTVLGDKTSIYTKGRGIRINQDNTKVTFVVALATYSGGSGLTTVELASSTIPASLTSVEYEIKGKSNTDLSVYLGLVPLAALLLAGQGSTPATPATGNYKVFVDNTGALKKLDDAGLVSGVGGAAFWTDVPGTPTRVSDTQFTITDTANANLYDQIFKKGVILKWLESGTFQTAMVISSAYSSNVVTIDLVGDSLTAGFASMMYCLHMAKRETFIVAGNQSTGTDLAKTWYPEEDVFKISVDARVKTAGTTNPTTYDVNDDGSTIITTKPSIASGSTSDLDNVCDAPTTAIAKDSAVTVDIDAASTTQAIDGYVDLFYYPKSWRYRS